jgi:phage terminase large subunit-like protein
MIDPLMKQVEEEAIKFFGADKIGTKELRLALTKGEKEQLLNWLIQRYMELGGLDFGISFF